MGGYLLIMAGEHPPIGFCKPLHLWHLRPDGWLRGSSGPRGADNAYSSPMVQLYVRLPTVENRTPDMMRALSHVMISAQLDRGCGHAELARDAEDASVLIYVEDWTDAEQLERRIRSDRFGALLQVMEACPAEPRLEIRFVSDVQGLDYVASVRNVQ